MYKLMLWLWPVVALMGIAHAQERPLLSIPQVVAATKKCVVSVQTVDLGDEPSGGYGGGSGFVFQVDYDKGEAYAITNHHVAGLAAVAAVTFWNDAVYRAELVATAPQIDVALLRIVGIPDERDLPDKDKTIIPCVLGDSDQVQPGESAIVIGSPGADEAINSSRGEPFDTLLLKQNVNANVVTGRDTPMDFFLIMWGSAKNELGWEYGTNFDYAFRTCTAINHGNSGGPMFNARGEAIGIAFAGLDGWLPGYNLNYSIPINLAKDFVFQILETGKYEKPWLGIDILMPRYVDGVERYIEFKERYASKNIEIYGVRKGSPAALAGLVKGDIILSVDGQKFEKPEDIRHYVFNLDIGAKVEIVIKHAGHIMDPIEVETAPKRNYDSEFSV
jgi:S1-C subfamily serine protease